MQAGLGCRKVTGEGYAQSYKPVWKPDWWSWREQFLRGAGRVASEPACAGAGEGSCPPVKASLAHQEAEEHMASDRRLLRRAQLTWARTVDATGCVCPISGDGLAPRGETCPLLALFATKSAPARWELGLFLPRERFRKGEAVLTRHGESRSGLGSACRREAVTGRRRRRKRRAGVGGNANVALPLRQLQPGKAAGPAPPARLLPPGSCSSFSSTSPGGKFIVGGMPRLGFPLSTP